MSIASCGISQRLCRRRPSRTAVTVARQSHLCQSRPTIGDDRLANDRCDSSSARWPPSEIETVFRPRCCRRRRGPDWLYGVQAEKELSSRRNTDKAVVATTTYAAASLPAWMLFAHGRHRRYVEALVSRMYRRRRFLAASRSTRNRVAPPRVDLAHVAAEIHRPPGAGTRFRDPPHRQ